MNNTSNKLQETLHTWCITNSVPEVYRDLLYTTCEANIKPADIAEFCEREGIHAKMGEYYIAFLHHLRSLQAKPETTVKTKSPESDAIVDAIDDIIKGFERLKQVLRWQ